MFSFSETVHESQAHHSLFCPWTSCSGLAKLFSFLILVTLLTLPGKPFGKLVSGHLCIISTGTPWSFSIPVHTFCHSHEVSFLSTFHNELLNARTMLGTRHSQVLSQSVGSSKKERNRQIDVN